MLKSVKLGTMQVTVNSDGACSEIVPELNAFGLPYLFESLPQAWEVLDGPIGDELASKLESHGYVVLAWWDNGIRKITHTKKPIATPEDIKGMKIRTPPSQVTLDAFQALGANPAPLAFSELPAALQSGVFEGQENPLANIYSSRLHELTPYIARSNHKYEMTPVLGSKRWFERPFGGGPEADPRGDAAGDLVQPGLLPDRGLGPGAEAEERRAKFNDVDVAAFKAATKSVYDKWEKEIGDIVPRIRAAAQAAGK